MRLTTWMKVMVVAGGVFAAVSCSDTVLTPASQSQQMTLQIVPSSLALRDGQSHPVRAIVKDNKGNVLPGPSSSVQWSSSAQDTIKVVNGVVQAMHPGRAKVIAWVRAENTNLTESVPVDVTPVAEQLQLVQGDQQSAAVSKPLPDSLVVRVLDRHGNGVPGYPVIFTAEADGGQVSPTSATSDSAGYASTQWTLAATPGVHTVTASAGTLRGSPIQFTSTAMTLEPPSAIAVTPDSVVFHSLTDTLRLSATVYGANGQAIAGWNPAWSSSDPQVVSVSTLGTIRALAAGNAQIVATVPGHADTVAVSVQQITTYLGIVGSHALGAIDDTVQLQAVALDHNGYKVGTPNVVWSSSAPSVATVDTQGRVVSHQDGSAQIKAVAGFLSNQVTVAVAQVPAEITLSPASVSVSAGDTLRITAEATDSNGIAVAGASYVWSSTDSSVARVNGSGLVSALADGNALITAAAGGVTGESAVNVGGSVRPAARLSLSPSTATLHAVGDTLQLSATAYDSTNTVIAAVPLEWTSLDPVVATVNVQGQVIARRAGTARIRVASGTVADTATVTVIQVAASVDVSPASASLTQGDSVQLSAVARDSGGAAIPNATFRWATSNASIATVSGSGLVHATGAGNVTIRATSSGASGSASVEVTGNQTTVARVVTNPTSLTLNAIGDTARVAVATYDASGKLLTGMSVAWRSLNTSVATVDNTGKVTARAAGLALVTAAAVCCSRADTTSVLVSPAVASVNVSPSQATLDVGSTQTFSATAYDPLGSVINGASFNWSSSSPSVAGVSSSGVVTGVGAGVAAIYATAGGVSDSAVVTVQSTGSTTTTHGSNEPSGFAAITNRAFNAITGDGWGNPSGGYVQGFKIVTDVTAPRSPSNVAQILYPAGFGAGNGPVQESRAVGANYTKLYISEWIKFSSNFYGNGAANKLGYLWQNVGGTSHNDIYWSAQGSGTGPLHLEVHYQGAAGGTGNLKPNVGSGSLSRNVWHHMEMLFISNTSGASNGIVRWWVDGTLAGNYTNFKYVTSSDSGVWKRFTFTSIWGGTSGSVPYNMYYWLDNYYASGG